MVKNPEDVNTFVTNAAQKGGGPGILPVCDYNPHVNGIVTSSLPDKKRSCGNRTGWDFPIIPGG